MPPRTLSHDEAHRFYDRFGARQDAQTCYERPALERLLPELRLAEAHALVEFGCGTGRLAAELLATQLSPECRYLSLDLSATMVGLARARVAPFGARAEVRQTDGAPRIDAPDGAFDRFLSCYVLDLLPEDEIRALLAEAHRVLAPGGLLGVAGLTRGEHGLSAVMSRVWTSIHQLRPALVGGCRPVAVAAQLPARLSRPPSQRGRALRDRLRRGGCRAALSDGAPRPRCATPPSCPSPLPSTPRASRSTPSSPRRTPGQAAAVSTTIPSARRSRACWTRSSARPGSARSAAPPSTRASSKAS
jgi:SAM-dependent methyltransferase